MSGNFLIVVTTLVTAALLALAKQNTGQLQLTWQLAAQATGIFGIFWLSWAYILAARGELLENWFGGLDKSYRAHQTVAELAFMSLVYHPASLILMALPANTLALYLLPGGTLAYTLGVAALYLLITLVVLTLFVDLPYYLWKQTHEWMGMVIILGGLHAMLITSDVSRFPMLRDWILAWAIGALAAFLYKRYIYYWVLPKHNYRLQTIKVEKEIAIATLTPTTPTSAIRFAPGQYAFFATGESEKKRDEHPFSIVDEREGVITIAFTVRGSFTFSFTKLQPGMSLTVRGPYGTFGERLRDAKEMVWIAGGIGVTPFISMAKTLAPHQKALLYHSRKNHEFHEELDQALAARQAKPNFTYVPHITGTGGRLTAGVVAGHKWITSKTRFFLCGPMPMMEELTAQLTRIGIRRRQIIYEDFGWR